MVEGRRYLEREPWCRAPAGARLSRSVGGLLAAAHDMYVAGASGAARTYERTRPMTSRGSLVSRASIAAATLLAASLTLAPPSAAGVYHVYSCRIPYGPEAGEPAPVQVAAGEGEEAGRWSKAVSGTGTAATDTCGTPEGALSAEMAANREHSNLDHATWMFTAPAGEKIVAGTKLWRSGNADGGSGYGFWFASPNDVFSASNLFGPSCVYNAGCHSGIGSSSVRLSSNNQVEVSAENVPSSHLYINASCSSASCPSGGGDEQGHAVIVYVYAADIALEEQSAPVVSGVTGELATAASLSGVASLDFHAEDSGSGVYLAKVSVDGKLLESAVVDPTELCREVSVPVEDGPAFLSAQPCPASTNGHVTLDTTKLSDGSHRLLVEVTNAAGNVTTVLERTIEVTNGGAGGTVLSGGASTAGVLQTATTVGSPLPRPNGVPASARASIVARWVATRGGRRGLHGPRLTGRFGERETIAGRLTGPAGEAIASAEIAISVRRRYGGAPTVTLGDVRTDRQGRFTIHLGQGSSSERLRLTYSPTLGGVPVASQSLSLLVPAGVLLHVTPSSVAVSQTIRLAGRVLGGPIPPGGKQVVLEARSVHTPWLQFLVLHADRSGRFHGSHRFRLPGPVRYRFRAVCPAEADFPYTTGISRSVSVWER
jgi:hypothetical protein